VGHLRIHVLLVSAVALLLGTAGCGSNAVNLPIQVDTDFSMSVTPAAATLASGGAGQALVIKATADGTFNQSISLVVTGLPSGVTATPAALTLTPGVAQNVILTAASNASATTSTVTITGTAGTLIHSSTVSLTVSAPPPAPDFSLSVNPTAVSLTPAGAATQVSIAATAVNGFTGSVTVALSGLPAGVSATPSNLTLTPGTTQSFSLSASASANAGSTTVTVSGTSGSLSHTATLGLSVTQPVIAPSPDFTLTATPGATTVTDGGAGTPVAVEATALNGFSSTVAVAIGGLPSGYTASPSTLTLTPGTAQTVTITASATAATGALSATFTGTAGTLTHIATIALTGLPRPIPDVTTYHYNNTRQGWNNQETTLTPANVNSTSFGKVAFYSTDGHVDAAPLFAANVPLSTSTSANLVYIATEHGSVYAFNQATGQQVWKTSVLASGETTSGDFSCDQITPEIGITATPVIDRSHGPNGTIYLVGMSVDASNNYHQRLHALDLATGAELSGSPVDVAATYPGTGDNSTNGIVTFDPAKYAERAALLLVNGTIYLTWTSHCDQRPYTGWVMGYSENTLQQTSVINLTPNGYEGSVWMAGYGMAADASGNIYFLDANGAFSGNFNASGFPADNDYGNAMIKLSTANGKLAVADFFQPYNTIYESSIDEDLGSGGAILIPNETDGNGSVHQLLVGAGKDDNIYVADTANMGKFSSSSSNSNVYQELTGALAQGAWSGPAFYNNTVYYGGQGDVLKAFPITSAKLAATPSSKSTATYQYPGTTPSVSSNGNSSAIVWAEEDSPGSAAVLHAYDATNLASELYNSNQAASGRDAFGNGGKFITPVVVNGNVFVGTPTGVAVFGLLPAQ